MVSRERDKLIQPAIAHIDVTTSFRLISICGRKGFGSRIFFSVLHILFRVIEMKNSKEVLSSVLKTTQMGQLGIRSALESEMKPELRRAMEYQLREYDAIEGEAHSIARERRWELPELNPSIRFVTDRMTKMRLSYGEVNSKIAEMMIRGNTSGVIKGLKNLHQLTERDNAVRALSQKLVDTESANVRQMKQFL